MILKNIALIGAFDRNNYGDLLFPIIVQKALEERNISGDFNYYGLVESNLESIGGVKTKSISSFYNTNTDVAIVVGGDVLPVKWTGMEFNLRDNYISSKLTSLKYKIFNEKKEQIARKKFSGQTNFPWVISGDIITAECTVIYNSVGGSNLTGYTDAEKKLLFSDLERADYISVRDRKTYENLKDGNLTDIQISPDSAVVMSKYFNDENFDKIVSQEVKEFQEKKINNYIVFQIGEYYSKGNIETIVREINAFLLNTDYSIILLPIGRAWGHRDQVPLKKINNLLKSNGWASRLFMPTNNTIYDTMYYISHSKLFMGTSLHGCITAISYGKKCIALDYRVNKLTEFLKEFSHENQLYSLKYGEIYKGLSESLTLDNSQDISISNKLIDEADKNFDNIALLMRE